MATAKRVQHRRGTTAEHAVFTGAQGEVTVDTDKKTAVIGDGATAGGFPLQLEAVSSIAALEAAPTHGTRYLNAGGRSGEFAWRVGDYTAEVTADTQQGIYIASSSDPTGAAGCWVRVFEGRKLAEWFGCEGDGVTDDAAAFQAFINQGGALGAYKDYRLNSQIEFPSNIDLELGRWTNIYRGYSQGGFAGALFRNANFLTGDSNIRISGGNFGLYSASQIGFVLWFHNVTTLQLDTVRISESYNSFAIYFTECTDLALDNCEIEPDFTGTSGTADALHMAGCTKVRVNGGRYFSADDAIAITTEYDNYQDAELSSFEISSTKDVVVNGAVLDSRKSAVKILIAATVTTGNTIENVTIANCPASYVNGLIKAKDETASYLLKDLTFENITSRGDFVSTQDGNGLDLQSVDGFRVSRIKCFGGTGAAANAIFNGCKNGVVDGKSVFVDLGATTYNVGLSACDNVKIFDSDITSGGEGVRVINSTNCEVSSNTITSATTGIAESGTSDWNKFENNRLDGNTTPMANIVGANTHVAGNRGAPTLKQGTATISASGSSVTVATGLYSTFGLQLPDIQVTPINTDWTAGGAASWRVRNISGVSFDIELDTTSSTAVSFAWRATRYARA